MSVQHQPLAVLAIGAHPDDVEIGCAGTLARCIRRGDRVTIAILCQGDTASADMPAEELVALRRQEAKEAAGYLGTELIQLDLSDYGVQVDLATKRLLAGVIRRARPDVVITHFHADYGSDHNHTCLLAVDATLAASVPAFAAEGEPLAGVPALFMMEPLGGYGFQPQVYVDITETIETKIAMFERHRSQVEWMKRHGGTDMREYITAIARFRGLQCGVRYAEGFIGHPSWGHVTAGRLLP